MKFSLSLALLALTVFSSANDTLYFYTQRSDCAGLSMIGSGGTNTCISAGSGPGPFYSVDKDDGDPNSNLYAYSDMGTCSDLIVQVPQTSCAAAPNGAAVVEAAMSVHIPSYISKPLPDLFVPDMTFLLQGREIWLIPSRACWNFIRMVTRTAQLSLPSILIVQREKHINCLVPTMRELSILSCTLKIPTHAAARDFETAQIRRA